MNRAVDSWARRGSKPSVSTPTVARAGHTNTPRLHIYIYIDRSVGVFFVWVRNAHVSDTRHVRGKLSSQLCVFFLYEKSTAWKSSRRIGPRRCRNSSTPSQRRKTPTKSHHQNSRGGRHAEVVQFFPRSLDVLVHLLEGWKQQLRDLASTLTGGVLGVWGGRSKL